MHEDIAKVLISRQAIAERIAAMARQIAGDLQPESAVGAGSPCHITLIPILTGSIIFVADLVRHLPLRLRIHLISVSSYPGTATQSRGAQLRQQLTDLPEDLAGHNVLVIDDILDSGNTLRLVHEVLAAKQPATLRTCVLLRKKIAQAVSVHADYVGFEIPDEFVVGYGLDYDDYYRNLPDIVTLKEEVIRR